MNIEEITDRQKTLLFVLVEEYLASGLPISSNAILDKGCFDCSSATIRNDLTKLENLGLVDKPHTSSGRVPTEAALKMYAADVVDRAKIDESEKNQIGRALGDIRIGVSEVLRRASEYLSDETKMVSLIMSVSETSGKIKAVDVVPISSQGVVVVLVTDDGHVESEKVNLEVDIRNLNLESIQYHLNTMLMGRSIGEISKELMDTLFERAFSSNIYIETIKKPLLEFFGRIKYKQGSLVYTHGLEELIDNPEFAESRRLKAFLRARNEEEFIKNILMDLRSEKSKVRVLIGQDNVHEDLRDLSLVFTDFTLSEGSGHGHVAVLGPTRMPYDRIIPLVDYIAEYLSEKLGKRIVIG